MAKILNIGSLNLDYVYAVPHFVEAGETLLSSRRDVFAGGKGLNQTVAAARAGAKVYHGGAVGADGDMLLDLLRDAGADVSAVARVDVPTGHAIIQVTPQGENAILILGGANRSVSPETVEAALAKVDAGDILLLQNEINGLDAIIRRAAEKGLRILFNPAPMEAAVKDLPPGKEIYQADGKIFKGASHGSTLSLVGGGELPKHPKSPANHFKNFLLGCRGEVACNSRFAVAGPLSQVLTLGCIAQRLNTTIKLDTKTQQIVGNPTANMLLKGPPPRKGWEQFYKV